MEHNPHLDALDFSVALHRGQAEFMEQIRVSQDQWHIGTYTVLFMLTKALDVIGLTAMAPNVKQLLNLSCDPSGG
jgi:hypothetical protein